MAQLRQDFERIAKLNTRVVIIGPDDSQAFRKYWSDNDLPFIGLPDPNHSVLDLFGQEVKLFKFGRMPAQVIIDREGIIRYAYYGNAMSDIPENDEIIEIITELNQKRKDN